MLRALGIALALWIAGPVVGNVLGAVPVIAVTVREGGVPETLPAWSLLAAQALLGLTFVVVAVGYARRLLGGLDLTLPAGRDRRWIGLGLGGSLSVWLASTALSRSLPVEAPASTVVTMFDEAWALVSFAVLAVTLVPVAEELLFRGAIQRRLSRPLGRWPAIALASLAFLSIHLFNFQGGSVVGLGLAFGTLLGVSVVLGYVYERSSNLAVPVAVHASYNATLFSLSLVGVIG